MPRSIQAFVWLSLVYIAWFSYWDFAWLIWPSARYLALLAKMPPVEQPLLEHAAWIGAYTRAAYFLLPFILFAGLTGVGRRGWARWGVVLVLVVTEAGWLFYVGYTYWLHPESFPLLHHAVQNWSQQYRFDVAHWANWVNVALELSLIALLFSPHAKPWFRRRA